MASVAPPNTVASPVRSQFFARTALLMLTCVILSFPLTYFQPMLTGSRWFSAFYHIHGAAFFGWIFLYTWQTHLAARGKIGERPMGLFVYTADGHVSIQISSPANPACIAPGKKSGPGKKDDLALPACNPKQMRALLDGTVTYWGTYTVDLAAGVVTHTVLSDVSNGYAGTVQPPPFRLNGDRLVIGDGKTRTRILERVRR